MKFNLHYLTLACAVAAGVSLSGCKDRDVTGPLSSMDSASNADLSTRDATLARNDADQSQNQSQTGVPMGSTAPDEPNVAASGSSSGLSDMTPPAPMSTSPNAAVETAPPGAGVPSTDSSASSAALNPTERSFVVNAAEGGMFEVAAAKLAADKASDSSVKSYGAMLLDDHTAANQKLQQLASRHGLTLPSTLPDAKQKELDKLSKASGQDFDRQFVQAVGIKGHKSVISAFEKASGDVKNPDLSSFVQGTLPTLRAHLSAAQNLPTSVRKTP